MYLEADNVGSYEHPDTLEEISQSVDEGSSDSQAAMRLLLTGPRRVCTRGRRRAVRVTMATMRVEVTTLV